MESALRALRELTSLAHRLKDNPLLGLKLKHRAYQLRESSLATHAITYVMQNADFVQPKKLCDHVVSKAQQFQRLLRSAHDEAVHTASLKLHKGSTVVAHGHPLVNDFISASKAHVHSPAHSRAKHAKIHDDYLIHHAVGKADFVLVGADAITPRGVVASAGAGLLLELAHAQGIPAYVAATGLHYATNAAPTQQQELLSPERITGIISELGVFKHAHFVREVGQNYPFTSSSWP